MSIPAWREISSPDYECDGEYQCLNCYERWDSSSSPTDWIYCPYCGIKFEFEQQSKPKIKAFSEEPDREWIIEVRTLFKDGSCTDWAVCASSRFNSKELGYSKRMLQRLKWLREDQHPPKLTKAVSYGMVYEFRASKTIRKIL